MNVIIKWHASIWSEHAWDCNICNITHSYFKGLKLAVARPPIMGRYFCSGELRFRRRPPGNLDAQFKTCDERKICIAQCRLPYLVRVKVVWKCSHQLATLLPLTRNRPRSRFLSFWRHVSSSLDPKSALRCKFTVQSQVCTRRKEKNCLESDNYIVFLLPSLTSL